MGVHIYNNHLGGLFSHVKYYETEMCGHCGESDWHLGYFKDFESLKPELVYCECDEDGNTDNCKCYDNPEIQKVYSDEHIEEIKGWFEEESE